MKTTRIFWSRDGHMVRMTIAWCGCSNDLAVIDADCKPTDFDNGVFVHGFDSVAEAEEYIRGFDPQNPPAWKVKYTDDDPFERRG
jgi:hypothetical protein